MRWPSAVASPALAQGPPLFSSEQEATGLLIEWVWRPVHVHLPPLPHPHTNGAHPDVGTEPHTADFHVYTQMSDTTRSHSNAVIPSAHEHSLKIPKRHVLIQPPYTNVSAHTHTPHTQVGPS